MATKGIKDWVAQMSKLSDAITSEQLVDVARDAWGVVRDQIEVNARVSFNTFTGTMFDPRSIIVNAGSTNKDKSRFVFAEAGVFRDDAAMAQHGLNPQKDMPRSMVAWWLEFGTQAHYTYKGVRARKMGVNAEHSNMLRPSGQKGDSITQGIKPTYFISKAFDMKADQAFQQLETKLGELIDRAVK